MLQMPNLFDCSVSSILQVGSYVEYCPTINCGYFATTTTRSG